MPLRELKPTRIRDLKESALCFSYDRYGVHILMDKLETDLRAVFLNGDYAFHCFNIEAAHDWKGLAVTDYELVVDVESAIDTQSEWPPLGAIVLNSGGAHIQVAVKDYHGFIDKEGLKLGLSAPPVTAGLSCSFKRWGFQMGDKDRPEFFWIDSDRVPQSPRV